MGNDLRTAETAKAGCHESCCSRVPPHDEGRSDVRANDVKKYLFAGCVLNCQLHKARQQVLLLFRPHAATWQLLCQQAELKASFDCTGPKDPRLPKAVWRGSTGGFGGLVKGRAALLNLGLQRPDLIDSGVLDWDVNRYGDDGGRLKEKMSFGEQVLLILVAF